MIDGIPASGPSIFTKRILLSGYPEKITKISTIIHNNRNPKSEIYQQSSTGQF